MKKITHTPTETVLDVLARSTCDGKTLTLPEQLDRKLYLEVAKALELLGGKWSKKQKCHVFDEDAQPLIDDLVATGTVVDLKKTYQFFPTPDPVVKRLIELAELQPDMTVLEPSAGDGAIAHALPLEVDAYVCEVQAEKRAKLRGMVVGGDFLGLPTHHKFDRIIANPPFSRGQDVEHVSKMIDHLKPGGRLVTVMSPGWRWRETAPFKAFRLRLHREDVRHSEWHALEPAAFRVSGTDVRTGILVVDKAVG